MSNQVTKIFFVMSLVIHQLWMQAGGRNWEGYITRKFSFFARGHKLGPQLESYKTHIAIINIS
jgi:hypothetical protein